MSPAPEPVVLRVTRYRCPFCTRSRSAKAPIVEHIGRCWNNPAVHGCKTCAHYESVPTGDPCFDGRLCLCNDAIEACGADINLADGLKTGCPLWRPTTT